MIRTQAFVVEISASIMPPLTEDEVRDALLKLAHQKERAHGMGVLSVHVHEGFNERTGTQA